jgi:uncharacterized SAM-binding protein YcdF (DUF218 family)
MRRLLKGLLVVVGIAWLVSLVLVTRAARRDEAASASAIVVLGAAQYNGRPSPVLKARLDHAADLYRRHLAPRIVITGGVGAGDTVSEAVVGRRYLHDTAGIADSSLISQEAGHTSEESLRAFARAAPADRRHIILVSDGFHMLRLEILARRLGLESLGSPAPTSPIRAHRRLEVQYLLLESVKAPLAFLLTRSE